MQISLHDLITTFDGRGGKIGQIGSSIDFPYMVIFEDGSLAWYAEAELVVERPVFLDTQHSLHGASSKVRLWIGGIIAQKERQRAIKTQLREVRPLIQNLLKDDPEWLSITGIPIATFKLPK